MSRTEPPLLQVKNLKKHYPITQGFLSKEVGRVRAVDGISFDVKRGETVGIVGESGCGKSTAATSLLRLEEPTDGEVLFDGTDITQYNKKELKQFRRRAQMIFQDPDSSFDPRMTVGESIAEPLLIHGIKSRERRREIAKDLLERVGLSASDIDRYPHEFSGGQKQRIGLARALVVNPDLIVADEPTSALDVSIQADILSLIKDIQDEFNLGIVFISHNMGVIREVCDRVAVMYLGEIVEISPTDELFANPEHPYTEALLSSIPQPDPRQRGEGVELKGDVPSPSNPPSGCRFHTRCPKVIQPPGYDFEQTEWRSLMNFRAKVERQQIDLEAARDYAATQSGVDSPEDVSDDELRAVLRDEFELPETLSDPSADSTLQSALDEVIADDMAAAAQRLREAFETVCETDIPEMIDVGPDHAAACHLITDTTTPSTENRAEASATTDAEH